MTEHTAQPGNKTERYCVAAEFLTEERAESFARRVSTDLRVDEAEYTGPSIEIDLDTETRTERFIVYVRPEDLSITVAEGMMMNFYLVVFNIAFEFRWCLIKTVIDPRTG